MSVAVFADTFHFLALLNSSDDAHVRAIGCIADVARQRSNQSSEDVRP